MNIDLQALEARHPAARSGAPAALRGLNLKVSAGEQVAVIGPSGAGKTTLARALVGLQALSSGYVRLDDSALTDWPAEQLGEYIGFLPQRVELFNGTIAENIAMMDAEAAPSAIVEAAKRAEVHDLILTLPSNPTTGYRWSVQDSAGGVLRALSPEVYSNPEDAGVVGAAGVSTWRFQAFAPGTGRLRLTSQQPWAPEVLPVDAFDCAISVN